MPVTLSTREILNNPFITEFSAWPLELRLSLAAVTLHSPLSRIPCPAVSPVSPGAPVWQGSTVPLCVIHVPHQELGKGTWLSMLTGAMQAQRDKKAQLRSYWIDLDTQCLAL